MSLHVLNIFSQAGNLKPAVTNLCFILNSVYLYVFFWQFRLEHSCLLKNIKRHLFVQSDLPGKYWLALSFTSMRMLINRLRLLVVLISVSCLNFCYFPYFVYFSTLFSVYLSFLSSFRQFMCYLLSLFLLCLLECFPNAQF